MKTKFVPFCLFLGNLDVKPCYAQGNGIQLCWLACQISIQGGRMNALGVVDYPIRSTGMHSFSLSVLITKLRILSTNQLVL